MSGTSRRRAAREADRGGAGVGRAVEAILRAVRRRGDAALRDLTRRYDGVRRAAIEVGVREKRSGVRAVSAPSVAALRLAARRIAWFASRQKRSLRPFRLRQAGLVLEQRLLPIERVGVYVPGGRYPLASSLLMGAIPARVAGCSEVVLCTPPRRDGTIAPEILVAAAIAGVDRIFAVGGAQAIAALAFGTETVPRVDLIVGPGNRYVAAAKARLAGRVGIDVVAGPTELMVIVDGTSDADRVSADLLAQAEHDAEARLWLVALPGAPVAAIRCRLGRDLSELPRRSRLAARASLGRLGLLRAADLEKAAAIANRLAPEHLSVQSASPRRLVPRLRHYGSLFLGPGSAVAFGDYLSGPNHILPTAGSARHGGGLSV
ncbi:MAG TPA: histidinol dehydrogenase, partial [Candidatus Polarisedimenticolia bacterium]